MKGDLMLNPWEEEAIICLDVMMGLAWVSPRVFSMINMEGTGADGGGYGG